MAVINIGFTGVVTIVIVCIKTIGSDMKIVLLEQWPLALFVLDSLVLFKVQGFVHAAFIQAVTIVTLWNSKFISTLNKDLKTRKHY